MGHFTTLGKYGLVLSIEEDSEKVFEPPVLEFGDVPTVGAAAVGVPVGGRGHGSLVRGGEVPKGGGAVGASAVGKVGRESGNGGGVLGSVRADTEGKREEENEDYVPDG